MIYTKTYENGLRVILQRISGVYSVSVGVYVKAGSACENTRNNGLSHLIEHMLFKGTKKRSAYQIADAFDSIGANVNAFTTKELTCYYAKSTCDHFGETVEIISDFFFNSIFDENELFREKNVILEEINMYEDSPDDLCSELAAYAFYGDHCLGKPIIGSAENVLSFTPEQIHAYMDRFYAADNVVIAVAGNIDFDTALNYVDEYFADKFSKKRLHAESFAMPSCAGENGFKYKTKPIEQANISIVFPSVAFGSDESNERSLLSGVFGGGMSSRLFQQIREKMGLAYTVYSYLSAYQSTGDLTVFAGVNPEKVIACVNAINDEIEKFIKKGITFAEFSRSREQFKSSLIYGQENTSNVMNAIGKYLLLLGKKLDIKKKISEIEALEYEAVNSHCDMLFCGKPAFSYVGTEKFLPSYGELFK